MKGVSLDQDGPFGHISESKHNFFCVSVIGFLVDCEVELNGIHPGDYSFIGAIKGLGFAKLKVNRFDCGRQYQGRVRWMRVRRYD